MGACASAPGGHVSSQKELASIISDAKAEPNIVKAIFQARTELFETFIAWTKAEDDEALFQAGEMLLSMERDLKECFTEFAEMHEKYLENLQGINLCEKEYEQSEKAVQKAEKGVEKVKKALIKSGEKEVDQNKINTLQEEKKSLENDVQWARKNKDAKLTALKEIKEREMWQGLTTSAEAYAQLHDLVMKCCERMQAFAEKRIDESPRNLGMTNLTTPKELKQLGRRLKSLDAKYQAFGKQRSSSVKSLKDWAKLEEDQAFVETMNKLADFNKDYIDALNVLSADMTNGFGRHVAEVLVKTQEFEKATQNSIKAEKKYIKRKTDMEKAAMKPGFEMKHNQMEAYRIAAEDEHNRGLELKMRVQKELNEMKTPAMKHALEKLCQAYVAYYKKLKPLDEWTLSAVKTARGTVPRSMSSANPYGMPGMNHK